MEMWMKIAWALLIGAMIVFLLPRAKAMMAASRQAAPGEWRSVLIPLLVVAGLVLLLVMSVRG